MLNNVPPCPSTPKSSGIAVRQALGQTNAQAGSGRQPIGSRWLMVRCRAQWLACSGTNRHGGRELGVYEWELKTQSQGLRRRCATQSQKRLTRPPPYHNRISKPLPAAEPDWFLGFSDTPIRLMTRAGISTPIRVIMSHEKARLVWASTALHVTWRARSITNQKGKGVGDELLRCAMRTQRGPPPLLQSGPAFPSPT